MDKDTYDDRIPRMNDQMNMRFIKLENELSDTRDKLAELSEIQQKQADLYTGLINVLDKQMMDLIQFKESMEITNPSHRKMK